MTPEELERALRDFDQSELARVVQRGLECSLDEVSTGDLRQRRFDIVRYAILTRTVPQLIRGALAVLAESPVSEEVRGRWISLQSRAGDAPRPTDLDDDSLRVVVPPACVVSWRVHGHESKPGGELVAERRWLFALRWRELGRSGAQLISVNVPLSRWWPQWVRIRGVPHTRRLLVPQAHRVAAIVALALGFCSTLLALVGSAGPIAWARLPAWGLWPVLAASLAAHGVSVWRTRRPGTWPLAGASHLVHRASLAFVPALALALVPGLLVPVHNTTAVSATLHYGWGSVELPAHERASVPHLPIWGMELRGSRALCVDGGDAPAALRCDAEAQPGGGDAEGAMTVRCRDAQWMAALGHVEGGDGFHLLDERCEALPVDELPRVMGTLVDPGWSHAQLKIVPEGAHWRADRAALGLVELRVPEATSIRWTSEQGPLRELEANAALDAPAWVPFPDDRPLEIGGVSIRVSATERPSCLELAHVKTDLGWQAFGAGPLGSLARPGTSPSGTMPWLRACGASEQAGRWTLQVATRPRPGELVMEMSAPRQLELSLPGGERCAVEVEQGGCDLRVVGVPRDGVHRSIVDDRFAVTMRDCAGLLGTQRMLVCAPSGAEWRELRSIRYELAGGAPRTGVMSGPPWSIMARARCYRRGEIWQEAPCSPATEARALIAESPGCSTVWTCP